MIFTLEWKRLVRDCAMGVSQARIAARESCMVEAARTAARKSDIQDCIDFCIAEMASLGCDPVHLDRDDIVASFPRESTRDCVLEWNARTRDYNKNHSGVVCYVANIANPGEYMTADVKKVLKSPFKTKAASGPSVRLQAMVKNCLNTDLWVRRTLYLKTTPL